MKRIHRYRALPSTQTRARVLADAGAPAWTVVRADMQTRGRGRMERRFASAKGGLYLTVLLRPRMKAAGLGDFSLKTGRLLTRILGRLSGVRTKVKEPNDVLALCADGRWRKAAGILIEASGTGMSLDWVLVGIGVNLNNPIPADLPGAAALGAIAGRRIGVERVYRELLRSLKSSWRGL